MKTAKRILISLIPMILSIVALFVGIVSADASHGADVAYADGKINYVYDFTTFNYRRNATGVAIYINGEIDEEIYFKVSIDEGEPYTIRSRYNFDCEGTVVKLWVCRDEDEVYNEYISEPRVLNVNTAREELIILPYKQTKVYDGNVFSHDDITFRQSGSVVTALNAGEYEATIAYELPLTVPFTISRAEITVTPKVFRRRYGEKGVPEAIDIIGNISDADKEYIEEQTFLDHDITDSTYPGTYSVGIYFAGFSENYNVTTRDSVCEIQKGLLSDFNFVNDSVLYDGEPHTLAVTYDNSKWTGITVTYDTLPVTQEGKYTFVATVKKDNYEDLLLTAVLTIRTLILESNNLNEYVTISGNNAGYDPTISPSLVASRIDGIDALATAELKTGTGYEEKVLFIYDVKLTIDGSETTLSDSAYNVSMQLASLNSVSGLRILRYNGEEMEEIQYTYDNGYINFVADGLDGFIFIKKSTVEEHSTASLIIVIAIAVVIILILGVILTAFKKSGKAKRRSLRRHSRWA